MQPLAITRDLLRIRSYHRRLAELPRSIAWQKVAYGKHDRQYGLWAQHPDAGAPIAIWLHGGAWQFGSPEILAAFGEYFFQQGYSVWMPSHRRLPKYRGCDILDDLGLGLSFMLRKSPTSASIVIGGMSSGGQLAALLALRQNGWNEGKKIEGLICCGAPLSLSHLGSSPVRRRLAGAQGSDRWCSLDPILQLEQSPNFPAVVLHGTSDGLVPFSSSLAFAAKAKQLGWKSLTFVALPGGDHLSAARWVFL